MKFSSSARRTLCGFLSGLCLFEWSGTASLCRAESKEPVLILKYSNQSISDETARDRFHVITAEIERRLDVRASFSSRGSKDPPAVLSEIDDATLKTIASRVSEAGRKMDCLENREADRELATIEQDLRKYRLGDATRSLLADVFLKRGTMAIWDANPDSAISFLKKARSLRPGFDPDPALYSPQFCQIWNGIGNDYPVEAEILVESIPPGATLFVDDAKRGMTPLRLKVPASRPLRLRLEHPGFLAWAGTPQLLPGDSGRIEAILSGDRDARLAGYFEGGSSEIREAAPIVSEMAKESGAARVAFLMLDRVDSVEGVRVLAAAASSPTPRLLGFIPLRSGPEGMSSVAASAAGMLAEAGWPVRPSLPVPSRRPWYYRWWFLTGVGLLAAGTAVALGGGGDGGGGDSSSSSSGVNF